MRPQGRQCRDSASDSGRTASRNKAAAASRARSAAPAWRSRQPRRSARAATTRTAFCAPACARAPQARCKTSRLRPRAQTSPRTARTPGPPAAAPMPAAPARSPRSQRPPTGPRSPQSTHARRQKSPQAGRDQPPPHPPVAAALLAAMASSTSSAAITDTGNSAKTIQASTPRRPGAGGRPESEAAPDAASSRLSGTGVVVMEEDTSSLADTSSTDSSLNVLVTHCEIDRAVRASAQHQQLIRDDGHVIDLILRNARLAGQDALTDLGVDGSVLTAVDAETVAAQTMDLGGRLVTPPLVEPHIHLDAVLTVGQPRPNVSGSLFEGIAIWAERVASLTYDDVQSRVRQILRWQLACGVQHVRSHVDVCDPQLRALRALIDLREELRGLIDLQLVAFPQQGILGYDGRRDLMRRAVELGADVVGGIPHYELTREDGVESVKFAMALADEHG